jgi:hypothetical protein
VVLALLEVNAIARRDFVFVEDRRANSKLQLPKKDLRGQEDRKEAVEVLIYQAALEA